MSVSVVVLWWAGSNVRLVDIKADPIRRITADGIETNSGASHSLDALVFATGFDAMTGSLLKVDPTGVDGRSLSEAWADGPLNYLGLLVPGFPNLFTITGPGSPVSAASVGLGCDCCRL